MSLENTFSWSKSRDEQFRECQRQYFYDKYASWGGWDRKAPKEARLAYILKNLKNRWAWKGETVHHLIEEALKSLRAGRPLSSGAVLDLLTQTMRADYKSSKAGRYYEEPKKSSGLFEHEYKKPVSDETWKNIHDTAADCIKNFLNSQLYAELTADDKNSWLVIEDLEEFDLEGTKVYVKLDFARKKGGFIEIYDWKTGKSDPEGSPLQMGVYTMYAMQKWAARLESIRTYLFNLSEPSPVPVGSPVTAAEIARTREFMAKSIEAMRSLLSDPLKNIPLPREHFKFTQNERICQFCNFYKICEKYNG